MDILVELNNEADCSFSKETIESVVAQAIFASKIACLQKEKLELSVAFVGEKDIQKMNFEYRKKDSPTDILSFAEYEKIEDACAQKHDLADGRIFLGELIVYPGFVENSAKENEVSFENEMAYILSHGVLHLLGFSHGEEMFGIQKEIVKNIN